MCHCHKNYHNIVNDFRVLGWVVSPSVTNLSSSFSHLSSSLTWARKDGPNASSENKMADFKIIRATMADRPRVVNFLRKAFYKYEPLNIAMGLTDEPSEADINHSLQSFPQGNSLLAVTNENKLVGVAINGEITDNEANVRQKLFEECDCIDFVAFLKFWVHVERIANFWKNTDEPKGLDLEIMAVDPNTRGQGIGNALMTRTKELAKEVGYKVFRVDCSSYYAGKLAESQGMRCVFEMNYDDYKDENGEIIFKIPPPHKSLRIFLQTL